MDLAKFDLNLLAVFEAVMQERSITRAARRLGLSQPATSQALGRLRVLLRDDLLVRGPDGMLPTARAERLAGPVREALAGLAIALQPPMGRPEDTERRFTLAVNGYTAYALTNQIVGALHAQAPRLQLVVIPTGSRDILADLDNSLIDLALTGMTEGGDRFKCSRVFSDRYVAVMRRGHPEAGDLLTRQALARMDHLTVTSTGDDTSFIDRALEEAHGTRHVVLSLPFLATPEALASSDLVAILPSRVATRLARFWNLVACSIDCPAPAIDLAMTWHRRLDGQEEHRWLRASIRRCLGDASGAA